MEAVMVEMVEMVAIMEVEMMVAIHLVAETLKKKNNKFTGRAEELYTR